MGKIQGSTGKALVLTASLLTAPGCAQWGDGRWAPQSYGVRTVVVDGEVRSVDARRGRLQLLSDRGRVTTVRVDRDTRVTYQRRSYPVNALERGDVVRIWVKVDRRGDAWADRVDVRRSVRDRYRDRYGYDDGYRGGYRIERLVGRVRDLDLRDGYFIVEESRDRTVAVHLPERLDRNELRRVERLRRGDRVELEVRAGSGDDDVELIEFR